MAQIVQQTPSIGERLGTGLGAGLQQLASAKLQQLAQRAQQGRISQALQGLGVAPEMAQTIALLPEQLQGNILQNLPLLLQGQPQQAAQGMPTLQQLAAPQYEVPMVGGLEFPQPPAPVSVMQPQQQMVAQPQRTKAEQLAQALISPAQRREEKKIALKEQQLSQQEKAAAFKETKAERKEILDKAKAARQNLHDLDRIQELEKSGKLDTPGYVEFLKRSGLDIPALMNPESEEFQKIAANFVRDAKSIFGSRVSNFEIEQFLKTIPSLSQSPEGRKRVIANLKNVARGNLEYADALKEIMTKNKGVPPLDLLEQVDEKVAKKQDKLAEKFKEDLAKPVPKGQNQYITGLQSTLGTVIGRVPKAAATAGAGALAGSRYLGAPGAIAGGVLGGLAGLGGVSLKDLL